MSLILPPICACLQWWINYNVAANEHVQNSVVACLELPKTLLSVAKTEEDMFLCHSQETHIRRISRAHGKVGNKRSSVSSISEGNRMAVAVRRLGRQSDDVEPHRQSFCPDDDVWLGYGSRHPAELVNITMLRRIAVRQREAVTPGTEWLPSRKVAAVQKGNVGMFSYSVQHNKASLPATETTEIWIIPWQKKINWHSFLKPRSSK